MKHRSTTPPIVVFVLAAACVSTFVRLVSLPDERAVALMKALAVVPSRLFATPVDLEGLLTLLTASFLHASWLHLIGNMLYLVVFGPAAEDELGHLRFVAVYLLSGVAGLVGQALAYPHSGTPVVGASASIAGVLGAYLVLLPRSHVTTVIPAFITLEIASLPAAFLVALWFVLQVAGALTPAPGGAPVAWIAHIAGFLTGTLLALTARGYERRRRR